MLLLLALPFGSHGGGGGGGSGDGGDVGERGSEECNVSERVRSYGLLAVRHTGVRNVTSGDPAKGQRGQEGRGGGVLSLLS